VDRTWASLQRKEPIRHIRNRLDIPFYPTARVVQRLLLNIVNRPISFWSKIQQKIAFFADDVNEAGDKSTSVQARADEDGAGIPVALRVHAEM
jgi:hypothetical protein